METVRAAQGVCFCETALFRTKQGRAYFAHDLIFGAVVFIKVWLWRVAARTGAVIVYIAFRTASDGLYGFAVPPLYIGDVIMVVLLGSPSTLNFWYLGEWESSNARCFRGMYLQMKFKNWQMILCWNLMY